MPEALALLRESLRQPPETGDIRLLLELWRHVEFRIRCRRPYGLEEHPDFAVRLRGAFGRALALQPIPVRDRPDPFRRPPPFEVLFGELLPHDGAGLPRPFVIDTDVFGWEVRVRLRVFGQALFWARQARDALIMALADGVSLRSGGRLRAVVAPVDVETEWVDGLVCPRAQSDVALLLRTPLIIRRGATMALDAHALASALATRAEGLARWQGLCVAGAKAVLIRAARNVECHCAETIPVHFRRHSRRQQGRVIPVIGLTGVIRLTGNVACLMPYLTVAAVAHIGSHAGLGLGRFDLVPYK